MGRNRKSQHLLNKMTIQQVVCLQTKLSKRLCTSLILNLMGRCSEERARLSSDVPVVWMRGNGHKLQDGEFRPDNRQQLFTKGWSDTGAEARRHWQLSTLGEIKKLNKTQHLAVTGPVLSRRWDQMDEQRCLPADILCHSQILFLKAYIGHWCTDCA